MRHVMIIILQLTLRRLSGSPALRLSGSLAPRYSGSLALWLSGSLALWLSGSLVLLGLGVTRAASALRLSPTVPVSPRPARMTAEMSTDARFLAATSRSARAFAGRLAR